MSSSTISFQNVGAAGEYHCLLVSIFPVVLILVIDDDSLFKMNDPGLPVPSAVCF
jgi:hypothetical protein